MVAGCWLLCVVCCVLFVGCCCWLSVVCSSSFADVRCVLFGFRCRLLVALRSVFRRGCGGCLLVLFVACCVLIRVCCLLFAARGALLVVYCLLAIVRYSWVSFVVARVFFAV